MNDKISVIVPIYNSSNTLVRTLDSIINQTYSNLEILLVNDGSTDDSLEICEEYKKKDSRIVIINQDNKGVGAARNSGIDISNGDYISFVDSDDTLDKEFFIELISTGKMYNADIKIVSLGALLHDIALICKVGDRKEHHINGKLLANEILEKCLYPENKKERVLGCIYNHRSSKNATNIEEICVADADVLAHFRNIPMLFNSAFNRNNISLNEVRKWMKQAFEKDYNDLSDKTKEMFKEEYKQICEIVIGR